MSQTAPQRLVVGAALLLGVGAAIYVWTRGGVANAAASLGSALASGAAGAVGGAVSGAVGAVGATVGLPTPDDTTTDAAVARWIIDKHGYFMATKWAGVPALVAAMGMDAGTGRPPPAGSQAQRALNPTPTTSAAASLYPDLIPDGASWQDLATTNPADRYRVGP